MSEEQSAEDCRKTIEKLLELCKKLHEENERLKEKIRVFYG